MNNNTGLIAAIAALLGVSMMCCVGGAGAFVMLRRAEPPPSIAPAPAYPYPPSGPAAGPVVPSYPPPPSYAPPPPPITGTLLAEGPDTPVRGPVGAPITIHVISDFQCPFCSRVEPTLQQLDATYPGQIRWVWHDYPLPFHTDAMPAAEAAREVRAQAGDAAFWTYHDQLFLHQRDGLDGRSLEQMASAIPGVDVTRFRSALVTHAHQAEVRTTMAAVDAAHSGIGTPSFQIGTEWLSGAQPFDSFRAAVERNIRR
jgi:protein-disulfide isomerase